MIGDIEEYKKKYIESRVGKIRARAEKDWQLYEGLVKDYLTGGYSILELCRKHNRNDRTAMYVLLFETLGLPRNPATDNLRTAALHLLNSRRKQRNFEMLKNCPCEVCQWLLRRMKILEDDLSLRY